VPIPGVPFHESWGVILNDKGRVLEPESREPRAGEYAAGWIKRGPSGVIGTNKPDAAETVLCMVEDVDRGRVLEPTEPEAGAVLALFQQRQTQWISWADWQRLDALEVERGRATGRPRVKFTRVEEMLAALGR
jgi:ferredoxin--NADP+ reductase